MGIAQVFSQTEWKNVFAHQVVQLIKHSMNLQSIYGDP